jgi:hypothetical protein
MAENEIITADGEIITAPISAEQVSLVASLTKAEIDQQIATAHAYPRSVSRATKNIISLVTMDETAAEECTYALPRSGKSITGPSIRLAEIVAGQWGNCRIGARVVHVDRVEKFVEAEGIFHDLETNTATTARVRRRIVDKYGKLYNDDMIIVTGNAAASIAKRNAILGGTPKAVWRKAYDAALATLKGDVKTLTERRDAVLKAFAAFGVKPEQLFAALSIGGMDDITLETMPVLIGMHSALKSGEATVEEMFGAGTAAGGERKGLKGKLEDVASGGKAKEAEKPKDEKPKEKAEGKADKAAEQENKPADDDFPGDTPAPSNDEIEAAKDRGGEAYHRGMSRRAIPQEYREVPALADAWLGAYDAAAAEDQGGAA